MFKGCVCQKHICLHQAVVHVLSMCVALSFCMLCHDWVVCFFLSSYDWVVVSRDHHYGWCSIVCFLNFLAQTFVEGCYFFVSCSCLYSIWSIDIHYRQILVSPMVYLQFDNAYPVARPLTLLWRNVLSACWICRTPRHLVCVCALFALVCRWLCGLSSLSCIFHGKFEISMWLYLSVRVVCPSVSSSILLLAFSCCYWLFISLLDRFCLFFLFFYLSVTPRHLLVLIYTNYY